VRGELIELDQKLFIPNRKSVELVSLDINMKTLIIF